MAPGSHRALDARRRNRKRLKKLKALGLLDWSIEATVMKFKTEFANAGRECAEFRLRLARDEEPGNWIDARCIADQCRPITDA
jgi:hypothetical protein